MTKKRPRIVDMCIYIDNNVYKKDANIGLIYTYIATIYKSLAFKQRMFQDASLYDAFGHFAAIKAIIRLTNKKQFLDEDDPMRVDKISSILNYIKSTLVPRKLSFLQSEKLIVDSSELAYSHYTYGKTNTTGISEYDSCYNGLLNVDVKTYLTQLKPLIWEVIKTTPYYSDIKMRYDLYISCLLTLVRAFTINNRDLNRLETRFKCSSYSFSDSSFELLFTKEWESAPVVWNLPKEFRDYVKILTIRIKTKIMESLKELVGYYAMNEDLVSDILMCYLRDAYALNFSGESAQ